jgi:hypothetical protein
MPIVAQLVSGGGLGLLVGFLLGLSVAQAVGGVIGAMAALLGAFMGLSGAQTSDRSWRIGAFGLFCVVGIALGLTVRAGGLFSPTITSDIGAWTAAGYPAEQARALVAFQRLGVKPEGMTVSAPPAASAGSSALFADRTSVCSEVQTLPQAAQLRVLRQAGGSWAGIAAAAEAASDSSQALSAALHATCG